MIKFEINIGILLNEMIIEIFIVCYFLELIFSQVIMVIVIKILKQGVCGIMGVFCKEL